MPADSSMTRVRQWVQQFSSADEDVFHEVGENFEYYLNHVEELENGEFEYNDLPNLEPMDKMLIHSGVLFGIEWGKDGATLYAVSDAGEFVGLYAHAENAARHVAETVNKTVDLAKLVSNFPVRRVSPVDADARAELETYLTSENEMSRQVGENLLFLLDNQAAIEDGSMTPDDLPHFPQNVKWLLAYSALFGRLWECSHPGLWAVLDADGGLVDLYGSPKTADTAATEVPTGRVQRVNVQDGDLPNKVVLGADMMDAE